MRGMLQAEIFILYPLYCLKSAMPNAQTLGSSFQIQPPGPRHELTARVLPLHLSLAGLRMGRVTQ